MILGLLRLLSAQAASSRGCQALLGARLGQLCASCLVPDVHSQPTAPVRRAATALLLAVCRDSEANLRLLLPVLERERGTREHLH